MNLVRLMIEKLLTLAAKLVERIKHEVDLPIISSEINDEVTRIVWCLPCIRSKEIATFKTVKFIFPHHTMIKYLPSSSPVLFIDTIVSNAQVSTLVRSAGIYVLV